MFNKPARVLVPKIILKTIFVILSRGGGGKDRRSNPPDKISL